MQEREILSIDPGIYNTGLAHIRVGILPGKGRRKTQYDYVILGTGDCSPLLNDETPLATLRKKGTGYVSHLLDRMFTETELPLFRDFMENQGDFIVVEENDNKYTKLLGPAIVGKLHTRHNRGKIHTVKPLNVWSSIKHAAGWEKGMKVARPQKKKMTRDWLETVFPGQIEHNSDDVNDALMNAIYFSRKISKKQKK